NPGGTPCGRRPRPRAPPRNESCGHASGSICASAVGAAGDERPRSGTRARARCAWATSSTFAARIHVSSGTSLWASYRGLDRRIWTLAALRGINTMGFSIVMPFMAMYIVEERGGRGATYGTIYLCSGLAAAIGNALAGELSDRIGRRAGMLTALLVRRANMAPLGAAVLATAPVSGV